MSISFSSLASTAFDTARSTFKAMAVAATPQGGTESGPAAIAAPAPASASPVVAQRARLDITESSEAAPFSDDTPKPVKRRVGTLLDSYA